VRPRFLPYLILPLAGVVALASCLTRTGRNADAEDRRTQEPGPSTGPGQPAIPPVPLPPPGPVDTGPRLDEAALDTANSVVDYARFCKQELGLPPAVLASWNCLEGGEIPLTVEGQRPTAIQYRDLAAGRIGCDRPAWLGDVPCSGYAFVQKRALGADVDGYLLCRMRSFTSPKNLAERKADMERSPASLEAYRALYEFDSLGLIWTNRKTGQTCFFDYVGKAYGGRVASPDDPGMPELAALPDPKPPARVAETAWKKGGRETWKAPKDVAETDNCTRCHDTGAVKASPWVGQVLKVGVNDPKVPYHVVGKVFDVWRQRFPVAAITTSPVGTEPQLCTSCHRIGSLASCDTHLGHAVGRTASNKLTQFGEKFWTRVWMPPLPQDWQGKPDVELANLWNERYDKHMKKMKCCCEKPNAKGCQRQPLDVPTLQAPVEGTGPEVCE